MSEQRTPEDLMQIRQLPAVEDRVETGPLAFGDDWPGIFIRGDNAILGYLPAVTLAAEVIGKTAVADVDQYLKIVMAEEALKGLAHLLKSCSLVKP